MRLLVFDDMKDTFSKQLQQFKSSEKVLYIPENRTFSFDKEELDARNILDELKNSKSLKDKIEESFDIKDPFTYNEFKKNQKMTNGYAQLFNILYLSYFSDKDILIIENADMNLHVLTFKNLLLSLYATKFKHIIITSLRDDLLSLTNTQYIYQIMNVEEKNIDLVKNYLQKVKDDI